MSPPVSTAHSCSHSPPPAYLNQVHAHLLSELLEFLLFVTVSSTGFSIGYSHQNSSQPKSGRHSALPLNILFTLTGIQQLEIRFLDSYLQIFKDMWT